MRILGQSKIVVQTKATGMLARLAHDLEMVDGGDGDGDGGGGKWAAEVVVPVRSLKVVGALKGGRVDLGVLSDGEKGRSNGRFRGRCLKGRRWRGTRKGRRVERGRFC